MKQSILISGDYAWLFYKIIEHPNGPMDRRHYIEHVPYSGIGGDSGLLAAALSDEGWDVYAQATLDETHWSEMIERELRRHGVDTRFVTLTPAGGGAVNFEEHSLDRNDEEKVTTYSRGTWSKYARHRPLTARDEVPELLSKLDFVPDIYAFNAPEAGYRALARALKAMGTKIVFFGNPGPGYPESAIKETYELADECISGHPFKVATVLGCKEYRDEDFREFYASARTLPDLPIRMQAKDHKLVYVHGSNSSGDSRTSHSLRLALPGWEVIAPDCPADPEECMAMLRALVEKEKPDVVIGSSMGGFYVHQLRGVRRICINPAFLITSDEDLAPGNHLNRNTARKDGRQHYVITPELLDSFHRMEYSQFSGINEEDIALCTGLFGLQDTEVPYARAMFEEHYGTANTAVYDGFHSIGKDNIRDVLVPMLESIVSKAEGKE